MASDEDFEDIIDDGFDHNHNPNPNHHLQHHQNLSRLSVCTSSTLCDDIDNLTSMCISHLSIESMEGEDADAEFSDGKDLLLQTGLSSASENDSGSCYSLPATPPRRRNRTQISPIVVKEYASENEAKKETKKSNDLGRRRRRRSTRSVFEFERGNSLENIWDQKKMKKKKEEEHGVNSGESDQSGGTGVMVITRPKGGNRSLCMDLEEVKACRDLGFELEHERISAVSFSNSTIDTSSGGNSPIANWRISGPGKFRRVTNLHFYFFIFLQ